MKSKPERLFNLFLLVSIIEGFIVAAVMLAIPGDPKNAFLFGYSKNRLVLVAAALVILTILVIALFNKRIYNSLVQLASRSKNMARGAPWFGGLGALMLWLTVFTPAYRLEELAASFTRLQPLLIWVALIIVQFALLVWLITGEGNFVNIKAELNPYRRLIFIGFAIFVATSLVFLVLSLAGGDFSGNQLYFPPGAPLSALQVMAAWVVFLLLLIVEKKYRLGKAWARILPVVFFIAIWAITFVTWLSTPLACTDDRPGPYPPNYVCYPHVNDAVYSIGSHYITLGHGVNNHWLTDKPLYMAFLALGQAVAGPGIEDYLIFQVAVVALLPALLYFAGRKKVGSAFGLLLAGLATLQGAYSLLLYRAVGSVNVKLENPEVLTALVLLVFGFTLFKWLSDPDDLKWAILSGGTLSLATLLRFNPVFIIPVLLLVLILANRRHLRGVIKPALLFLLAFGLVFTPWFLAATDRNGRNHYFTKIDEVISSRFGSNQDTAPQSDSISPAKKTTAAKDDIITYQLGAIDKAGVEGILFHFLNNYYGGLAKLPTTIFLHPIEEQVNEGIWDIRSAQPLWKKNLRVENLLALALNLALVLAGVIAAWKKYGLAGLTGIIIQAGYYAGNAVSQTSGGRYLEPVHWVTLVYYCLGILTLTLLLFRVFSRQSEIFGEIPSANGSAPLKRSYGKRIIFSLLGYCLLIGLVLPALNLLPSSLPAENDIAIEEKAYTVLSTAGVVTESQWTAFLANDDHVLVQGVGYHPRYYRSNFYRAGNLSFELMLLAKDHVFVGYSPRIEPRETFSDGSGVILVGCRIGEDTLWAAERVILESIAVIQLDYEEQLLLDGQPDWNCGQ